MPPSVRNFARAFSCATAAAGADQVITAYEDRPMTEMVKAHLGPLGGIIVAGPEDANLLLYVNAPAEEQGNGPDQYVLELHEDELAELPAQAREEVLAYRRQPHVAGTLREMYTVRRDLPEFVRSLAAAVHAGYDCAVVDVAYVNAGDAALGDLLLEMETLSQLAAYGGWNTAGNTLGCVLAQAVIRRVQRQSASPEALAAHARFLFLRLVEDLLYMSQLRTQIMFVDQPQLGLPPTMGNVGDQYLAVRALVEERAAHGGCRACAAAVCRQNDRRRRFAHHHRFGGNSRRTLPWQRLFDLTLEVALTYAELIARSCL